MKEARPFWHPYWAGIALGLVLLASFVVTGKGLGGSGAFKRLGAAVLHAADPTWAEENGYIKDDFSPGRGPLNSWIVFLGLGVALGGALGALSGRRFRLETIRGPRLGRDHRWLLALCGGVLSGVAAQIARGCTSGQALTGGAQLALGSWVFMFAMFGAAYALAYVVRKQWI
ncbi:MAG: YeeE/YedE thiosulfate transporter family protein [Acidobacteriota bacterium]